jgi:hypothetical protein
LTPDPISLRATDRAARGRSTPRAVRLFASRVFIAGLVSLAASVGSLGIGLASASATPGPRDVGPAVDEGSVVITTPDGTPLSGGGSATPFTLQLPENATCPGDSANDDWRVQGFMIPTADDPGTIAYGVIGPEGTQFALFAFDTRPFAHQLLPVNAGAGQQARIATLPELTFTIFPPGAVPAGPYKVGIACTYFRSTAKYWDAEIVVTDSAADEPSQFVWTVVDAPADAVSGADLESDSGPTRAILIGSVALLTAAAAGAAFWFRRNRHSTPPSLRGVQR